MQLYYVIPEDEDLMDAFVREMSPLHAAKAWQTFTRVAEMKVQVITLPDHTNVMGLIPWDTLKTDEFDL